MNSHYGTFAPKYVEMLLKNIDDVIETYDDYQKQIYEEIKSKLGSYAERLSSKFSLIITAYVFFEGILEIEEDTLNDAFKILTDSLDDFETEIDIARKAYDVVMEDIFTNKDSYLFNRRFDISSNQSKMNNCYGIVENTQYIILRSHFDEVLKKNGFNNVKLILRKWIELGIIVPENRGNGKLNPYNRKSVFQGTRVQVVVINIFNRYEDSETSKSLKALMEHPTVQLSQPQEASSEWCQLIFEGKNQAYGAYRMRANSTKRHNVAMLIVVIIAAVGFSIPTLLKLATPEQKEVMTEVTTLSKLAEPEIKQEEMKRVEPVAPPPPALKSSIKFTAPVIKKDEEVHEDDEIKSQEDLNATKVSISIADVKGNDEANGKDIADLKQVVTQAAPEPEKVFDMVEQMPTFPGGQQELMAYLGKNIKYPTIAQENGTQGRVIIQFVVERDGSINDVRVARGVDPYLDKEAVRVVKSMPKWLPGKQNGKAVRVKFTVPVMFRLQ